MDRCALCGSAGCDCALSSTVDFVRAMLQKELEHLAGARSALLQRIEEVGQKTSAEDLDRLNGLIHRLWIRFLALEDLGESFERAVFRALDHRRVDMSIDQRAAERARSAQPDSPSSPK